MKVKACIDEDFVNYKNPVMFIGTISCSWKCCTDAGLPVCTCQNSVLSQSPIIEIDDNVLIERYLTNDLTEGICFGGLEPFDQFDELYDFIMKLRNDYNCDDTIIIYTGYYPKEIATQITLLKRFHNIIIKFGRYIPGDTPHFDDVLGIQLSSDNQYAQII